MSQRPKRPILEGKVLRAWYVLREVSWKGGKSRKGEMGKT